MLCPGSGVVREVHNARLIKHSGGIHKYVGGNVYCSVCDTYVRFRGAHAVPVDETPIHKVGNSWPIRSDGDEQ
jgi:hypothetical protein